MHKNGLLPKDYPNSPVTSLVFKKKKTLSLIFSPMLTNWFVFMLFIGTCFELCYFNFNLF